MKISSFYNNEYMLAALYASFRSIANYIDGLKPSGRKVIYTVDKFNIRTKFKSSQLCSKVAEETQYMHGEDSLHGVVVGFGQNYVGSNNCNVLMPDGNFGSRYVTDASHARYIYTYKSPQFDKIFNSNDTPILEEQYFEGDKIEYKYYVPVIPFILLNGCEGIGNGFAQKILPRSMESIKTEIEGRLSSAKYKIKPIIPFYKDFTGDISPGDEPNRWIIRGKFERVGVAKIRITEVPIGYDLKSYLLVLDELINKKIVKSCDDNSRDDKFDFTCSVTKEFALSQDDVIYNTFKLEKTISENYTCVNENNSIIEFKSDSELLEAFIDVRLKFYTKRKKYLVDKINRDILIAQNKTRFIHAVIADTSTISNKKKSDVEKWFVADKYDKVDDSYTYLLNMPIYSLTTERIIELDKELKSLQKEFTVLSAKTPKKLWQEDLNLL